MAGAYLTRNLKLANISSTLTSQIFRKTSFSKCCAFVDFNIPTFRHPCTFLLSSFRSFGSSVAESEDSVVDFQGFQKWSNGGGLFHNSACIDPAAIVEIGAVIHPNATLGANVHIGSGCVVGPRVIVGHSTKLGYNVTTLFVKIGNHVELGANTCIDRGSWRDTTIGDYTKIDNLVQIGHNVIIGKNCILCGQVGIAGSSTVGDYVTFGGRVAVRDHVSIVSKVRFAANSCVTKDIKEPGDYGGFPAVPAQQWRRQVAAQQLTYKKEVKSS